MTGAVIVGASLGGLRVAEGLRAAGYEDRIRLVGAETHRPYDRPPLSKDILTGGKEPSDIIFRSDEELTAKGIELVVETSALGLDVANRRVQTTAGDLEFEDLVVATGARARQLPGSEDLDGVHTIRTLDDAESIRESLRRGSRVVVVGAGFIGAEVAGAARALGLEVTVVEAMDHPLERAVGREAGAACASLHIENGTTLICGVGVDRLTGDDAVQSVVLADGRQLDADLVVVGIGVQPNVEWLDGSGVDISNGVLCDERLGAAPGIYAVGDIARWANPRYGETMRIEHWTTTVEQAAVVAHNVANPGSPRECDAIPYFWSDQYGHRIQFAGRATEAELVEIGCRPDVAAYLALYRRGDTFVGALAIDGTVALMQLRGRLMSGADDFEEVREFAESLGGSNA